MEETNREEKREEEHGVTFGAICHAIFQWKRLLVILAVTLAAAIATGLLLKFYINPRRTSYEAKFNFHVVCTASSADRFTSGQYFTEEETLNAVKNSDDRFGGVDVKNMLPDGKYPITVTQEFVREEDRIVESYYRITVSETVFSDAEIAKEFVRALVDSVKDRAVADAKALSAADEYGFNGYQAQLREYEDAETYEEKLSLLSAQRDYLLNLYNGWIGQYGNLYQIKAVNKSLADLREAVQQSLSDTKYNELARELDTNAYIPGSENSVTLRSRLNTYNEQLDLNRRKLENLKAELSSLVDQYKNFDGASSSLMPQFGEFHSRIAALTEENADLQKKIETIEGLLGDEASKAEYLEHEKNFKDSLQKICESLTQRSKEIAPVAEEIATRESYTIIDSIEEQSGMNTLLLTAAAAVLVFLLSSAVCYGIVNRRGKRTAEPDGAASAQKEDPRE